MDLIWLSHPFIIHNLVDTWMVCPLNMGVSENVVYPIVPNGFADHYPVFKWLFHWEYTLFEGQTQMDLIWLSLLGWDGMGEFLGEMGEYGGNSWCKRKSP